MFKFKKSEYKLQAGLKKIVQLKWTFQKNWRILKKLNNKKSLLFHCPCRSIISVNSSCPVTFVQYVVNLQNKICIINYYRVVVNRSQKRKSRFFDKYDKFQPYLINFQMPVLKIFCENKIWANVSILIKKLSSLAVVLLHSPIFKIRKFHNFSKEEFNLFGGAYIIGICIKRFQFIFTS